MGKTIGTTWHRRDVGQAEADNQTENKDNRDQSDLRCAHLAFDQGTDQTEVAASGPVAVQGLVERVAHRERRRCQQQQRQQTSER